MKSDFGQWRVGVSPSPQPQEQDMPYLFGSVDKGKGAITSISIPGGGLVKNIGFFADTGLAAVSGGVHLRVAVGHGGSFALHQVVVDSGKPKVTVPIPADADSISVQRENVNTTAADEASVGWDVS